MANSINGRSEYVTMLDKVYQLTSKTSVLDTSGELVQAGANAKEIKIPKMTLQGLGNYNKATGYVAGDVTLEYETKTCDYDRGRMFIVDAVENKDTADVAFGNLSGEFLRTKVVPELDAWRISKYATNAGTKVNAEALADGESVVKAISTAKATLQENEVDISTVYLFITPTNKRLVDDMDTTKSKKALDGWAGVIEVPQSRMYTGITLAADGAGGYTKESTSAMDINFIAVAKEAALQFQKHVEPKIIDPEANQDADAWKFGYRTVGLAEPLDNKVKGIYVHSVTKG